MGSFQVKKVKWQLWQDKFNVKPRQPDVERIVIKS